MSAEDRTASGQRVKVVLCWHMHQPQYCDLISNQYHLPWSYLHGIKDYADMAAHLESVPAARAVVNFAPVLLEQLDDYAQQINGFLTNGVALRDPLLAALAQPVLPATNEERRMLLRACLRANEQRMIGRFAPFLRLATLAREMLERDDVLEYLGEQFYVDLIVWYHLAWLGESVRRTDPRARALQEKAGSYTIHDRRELLALIGELLGGLIPRYTALARRGQIELSVTPYAHPILPLMQDLACAREAMPDAPLPLIPGYPDGASRARWHVRQGLAVFERYFGFRPSGCWPAEGSVSTASLRLLFEEGGFSWAASGETVLSNSLSRDGHAAHDKKTDWLYSPYQVDGLSMRCFFRDDGLSDLIGFTYATWHADDAVANLVHHLEQIAEASHGQPQRVVTIVLDGENAWEYYPENGHYFLSALYRTLSDHPRIELTTFSDCLESVQPKALRSLVAGSWVYGTFSTWIGDTDKNRGWDLLGEAKRAFDSQAPGLSRDELARATRQLAVCEGSDWFWWFGGYNPAETVSDFERLYRRHLSNLYQLLHAEPPDSLAHSFTHGSGSPAHGGTMRHGQAS